MSKRAAAKAKQTDVAELSQTDARKDRSNRREIPLSSFDFLNGAYKTTRQARMSLLVLIGLLLLAAAVLGVFAAQARASLADARANIDTAEQNRLAQLEALGEPSGTDASITELLRREQSLNADLERVAATQLDYFGLLGSLIASISSEALMSRIVIGGGLDSERFPDVDTSQPGEVVQISGVGEDIVMAADWGDQVLRLPFLSTMQMQRAGDAEIIVAGVESEALSPSMSTRLVAMQLTAPDRMSVLSADAQLQSDDDADESEDEDDQ